MRSKRYGASSEPPLHITIEHEHICQPAGTWYTSPNGPMENVIPAVAYCGMLRHATPLLGVRGKGVLDQRNKTQFPQAHIPGTYKTCTGCTEIA